MCLCFISVCFHFSNKWLLKYCYSFQSPVDSEKLPTSGICCSDFESCGCFHYNSRYCLIPCLKTIGVKCSCCILLFDNDAWEDYCARTRKYDTCWKKFNVTTRWNKECPTSHANKVGFLSKALYYAKDTFLVCWEVVSGTPSHLEFQQITLSSSHQYAAIWINTAVVFQEIWLGAARKKRAISVIEMEGIRMAYMYLWEFSFPNSLFTMLWLNSGGAMISSPNPWYFTASCYLPNINYEYFS